MNQLEIVSNRDFFAATSEFFNLSDIREEVEVKFPKLSAASGLPDSYLESERQINELKWRKERMLEDMKREQALWDNAKFNFERKKKDFLKFLADSSSYATQVTQVTPMTYLN